MKPVNFVFCLLVFGLFCSLAAVNASAVKCDADTYLYVVVNKDRSTVANALVIASVDGIVVDTKKTDDRGETTIIIPMDKFPDDSKTIDVLITASLSGYQGNTIKTTMCGTPPDVSAILVDIKSDKENLNASVNEKNATYSNESREYCGYDICNGMETYETCHVDCRKPENKTETTPETKPGCLTDNDCLKGNVCKEGKCIEKSLTELRISVQNGIKEGEEFTLTVTSNGNPVSGVSVTYNGKTETTDSQGKVTFIGVYGNFTITAEKEGYSKASAEVQITRDVSAPDLVNKGCKKDVDCPKGKICKDSVCLIEKTDWSLWLIILAVIIVIILLILWSMWKKKRMNKKIKNKF